MIEFTPPFDSWEAAQATVSGPTHCFRAETDTDSFIVAPVVPDRCQRDHRPRGVWRGRTHVSDVPVVSGHVQDQGTDGARVIQGAYLTNCGNLRPVLSLSFHLISSHLILPSHPISNHHTIPSHTTPHHTIRPLSSPTLHQLQSLPSNLTHSAQLNTTLSEHRFAFAQAWHSTLTQTSTGRAIDALICPCAPSAGFPHGFPVWWGYFSLWNLLDCPSVVLPLKKMRVDVDQDVKEVDYVPKDNVFDRMNWEICECGPFSLSPLWICLICPSFYLSVSLWLCGLWLSVYLSMYLGAPASTALSLDQCIG